MTFKRLNTDYQSKCSTCGQILFALFFALSSVSTYSQNLVVNGDFEIIKEQFSFNQTWFDEVDMLIGWKSPNKGTPNFFHPRSIRKDFCCFERTAYSGDGFVGIGNSPFERTEYIQGELTYPLIKGISYNVTLYVLASVRTHLFSDCLGLLISKTRVHTRIKYGFIPRETNMEIRKGQYLSNREDWIKLTWDFVAEGGEKYITVGCFDSDRQVQKIDKRTSSFLNGPYILIDQIVMKPCSDTTITKMPSSLHQ